MSSKSRRAGHIYKPLTTFSSLPEIMLKTNSKKKAFLISPNAFLISVFYTAVLLAPTGALYVMMCYYISSKATF